MDRTARFEAIFRRFAALGYNLVPAHPKKKHPSGPWKGLSDPDSRRVTDQDIEAGLWVLDAFPDLDLEPFLFPASHATRPLVVVDIDDLSFLDRTIEVFGDSPIKVRTRRGVHIYYRTSPETRVPSRHWVFGEKSIDVKSFGAGVMSPGAEYLDGIHSYVPEPPLEEWTDELLDSLPVFNLEAYDRIWTENRPKARATARAQARPETHPFVSPRPVPFGGLEFFGEVRGDVLVRVESTGREVRLDQVRPGAKVHAIGREDAHASGQIWSGKDNALWYTDHTLGTIWRVLTGDDLTWADHWKRPADPIPSEWAELRDRYGVEVFVLPDSGWISDQIDILDGLTLIRAPHGTGKTILARNAIKGSRSAITVTNTSALAEHNAERFGIASYKDGTDEKKISTTLNSLSKIKDLSVELVHVDEADAVHGYLHTGKVPDASRTLSTLLDLIAQAHVSLITSADLSLEDAAFYIETYRSREPDAAIRVFVRPPEPGRRTIEFVSLSTAKARFERAFSELEPGDFPIALGWTARSEIASIAWGYANRREDIDLRSFWISGENSRYRESVERFRGTWTDEISEVSGFLESADVFFFSPALQSGVSLENETERVFILHTKPDFEAETIGQMLTRFRKVTSSIIWGVSGFKEHPVRFDDRYLDGVCIGLADETDRKIVQELPEFVGDFPEVRALNPEFAWSWRITQRKIRRSYADPIGRAREVIEAHGWNLVEDLEPTELDREDAKKFNRTKKVGRNARRTAEKIAIAQAEDIDAEEAERIDRAYVQDGDDAQKSERFRIRKFYGVKRVSEDLIEMDDKGRFRKQIRTFVLLWLNSIGRRDVIAFRDAVKSRGRQPSEYIHALQKTDLLAELHSRALRRPFGDIDWTLPDRRLAVHGDFDEHDREELRDRVMDFMADHAEDWSALFGRVGQPGIVRKPEKAVAWLGAQFRRSGGLAYRINNRYLYDWSETWRWSEAERIRILEDFDREHGINSWARKIRGMNDRE